MTDGPYLLGIDMGTGGARAGVFDLDGNELASVATEWRTDFPRSGRAEQDPAEWWTCIVASVRAAVEKAGGSVTIIEKKVLAADEAKRKKTAAKRAKSAPKKAAASEE